MTSISKVVQDLFCSFPETRMTLVIGGAHGGSVSFNTSTLSNDVLRDVRYATKKEGSTLWTVPGVPLATVKGGEWVKN